MSARPSLPVVLFEHAEQPDVSKLNGLRMSSPADSADLLVWVLWSELWVLPVGGEVPPPDGHSLPVLDPESTNGSM